MTVEKENDEGPSVEDQFPSGDNGDAEGNNPPVANKDREPVDGDVKEKADDTGEVKADSNDADADTTAGDNDASEDTTAGDDEDKDDAEHKYDVEAWGSTGNDVGDSVLELLASAELTPDAAKALLYDAVAAGKPEDIDVAALTEKVGAAKAKLVMAGIKNFVTEKNAATAETQSVVYGEAGGQDKWELVRDWSRENLNEKQRGEYNTMFDNGGAQARFAAAEMIAAYNKDGKNTSVGKTTTLQGDGKATTKVTPISKRQYAEQLEQASRLGKGKAEIAKIQRAREAGRKAGI